MRRAVTNNCRTKICFNPSDSENTSQIAGVLQGIDKTTVTSLGKYRDIVQKPSKKNQRNAVIFNTYPPWEADYSDVNKIKTENTAARNSNQASVELTQSLGKSVNAGQEKHQELLATAKKQLEERGFHVNLLYKIKEKRNRMVTSTYPAKKSHTPKPNTAP